MNFPEMSGFGHIDLTVTDLERSVRWWEEVLGFKLVYARDRPAYKVRNVLHPCGLVIGLMTHTSAVSDRFDERAVGLDHFAFGVPDRNALNAWAAHLDHLGIEHSGVQDENGGSLIAFRDPDNIQLELWVFDPNLIALDDPHLVTRDHLPTTDSDAMRE